MKEKRRSKTATRINTFRLLYVVVAFETVLGQVRFMETDCTETPKCIYFLYIPLSQEKNGQGDSAADKSRLWQQVTLKAMDKCKTKFSRFFS
jgi:hypothetical protein